MLKIMKIARGFTIVELVVIITTLGILITIGLVSWGALTTWSQNQQRGQELAQWKSTFSLYKTRFAVYPEPAGTLPFSACLGNDFPAGRCGSNGSISQNNDLMTQVAKVGRIPAISHIPVAETYVGPYVTYSTTEITLIGIFKGGSGDCPDDTTFDSSPASDVVLCKIVLTR